MAKASNQEPKKEPEVKSPKKAPESQQNNRERLQKIREKGILVYKKRLSEQLEADCRKKLMVINILFLCSAFTVALMYYTDVLISANFKLYDLIK